MYVEFVNPYYTDTIRDYVAVQMPTGEIARLISDDGQILASVACPGNRWPELLSEIADIPVSEIESADTQESFE